MLGEGDLIGNYRILSRLGVGGMGTVFLAEHPLIGKKVGLKVIHRELSGNREVVQRFSQEARAVNKIGSPHIVEIHDFGQSHSGDYFYIMEFLEGQTLASLIDRERRVAVPRALHIVEQLTIGLAAAHSAGVIHRDLKPDNIMLVERHGDPDYVKILDFGLAKMFTHGASAQLTGVGIVLGTPQYMSPEACESRGNVDHRTDIYALGVLLFQMVTGRLPFDGPGLGAVMVMQVTQAPPSPRSIVPDLPEAVEQIILRCLAKPVDARFSTMNALRDAVVEAARQLASTPGVMPRAATAQVAAVRVSASRGLPLPAPANFGNTLMELREASGDSNRGLQLPTRGTAPLTAPIAAAVGESAPRFRWLAIAIVMLAVVALVAGTSIVVASWMRGTAGPTQAVALDATKPSSELPSSVVAVVAVASDARPVDLVAPAAPIDAVPQAPVDATTVLLDATAPGVASLVTIVIEGSPVGAEVVDSDGKLLGKIPLSLQVPKGQAVVLQVQARGRVSKSLELSANDNERVTVSLRRTSGDKPAVSNGGSAEPRKPSNDLMNP